MTCAPIHHFFHVGGYNPATAWPQGGAGERPRGNERFTTGQSNGEMALWIDGKLVSHLGQGFPKGKWVYDKFLPGQGGKGVRWSEEKKGPERLTFPRDGRPFEGFQWRTNTELNLNFLWLLCYITKAPQGHVSKIWFDNIVVAQEYIGPINP